MRFPFKGSALFVAHRGAGQINAKKINMKQQPSVCEREAARRVFTLDKLHLALYPGCTFFPADAFVWFMECQYVLWSTGTCIPTEGARTFYITAQETRGGEASSLSILYCWLRAKLSRSAHCYTPTMARQKTLPAKAFISQTWLCINWSLPSVYYSLFERAALLYCPP